MNDRRRLARKIRTKRLRCMVPSGSDRYNIHVPLHSISCASTSISIYDELILTKRKMIATAQRKHDDRVHLK